MKLNQNLTTLYIVRHGQTEWNVKKLMQGHSDSPLTTQGIEQARRRGETLRHVSFDAVFSSDLLRARRTAELITLEKNLAVTTTHALRERFYGSFEGKSFAEYEAELKKLFEKYQDLSEEQIFVQYMGNLETKEQAGSRFITFLREIAVAYRGKTVLVVTHGGVMRYFLNQLVGDKKERLKPGSIENTAFIKVESDGVDFFVKETEGIQFKEK